MLFLQVDYLNKINGKEKFFWGGKSRFFERFLKLVVSQGLGISIKK